jgi:uncharacterized membrane protein
MSGLGWIAFWSAAFVITHLGMTASSIRPRLVRAMGDNAYLLVYSLISFAAFIPLTIVFFRNKHAGAMLWNLRAVEPVRWLTIALVMVAVFFTAAAFVTPSPAGLAPNAPTEPIGVLKLTRHPLFIGISIFGIAHMLINGWVGDLVYFGQFVIVGVIGAIHQDQRKLQTLGEKYRRFYSATSLMPGAALIDGRQRLGAGDLSVPALALGAILAGALIFAHPYVFGGSPLQ